MSQKKNKRARSLNKQLQSLKPIVKEAYEEIGDENVFKKWAVMAAAIKQEYSEVTLNELLPSRIDKTVEKIFGIENS
ncbi:MAG: hypothetical protein HQK54_12985 [Oligoflexales bacterium]|nr:hypothetical protein [Oligoflexales bacterium]